MSEFVDKVSKRRTFAIISHPDAGKTTLTEKFLLYGGAIQEAGMVKGKQNMRHAVSDWMEIEKQRGISVTSSVLQFNYDGFCINILDTPGHQDFSEDTYRTLMAADSAVMVIDASKGVEAQTRKLFKVCAMRHIPIFTFINKMDREEYTKYNEVLFSTHSCAIEGNSFSVDDTRELKEKGLGMIPAGKTLFEAFEMLDHFEAFEYVIQNAQHPLDEALLKEINKRVTLHTISYRSPEAIPGEYTTTDMAAGDTVFGDHEQLIAKVPKLLESTEKAIASAAVHPMILAARFHGFYEYLHPFRDGNGRTGRLVSNYILLRSGHPLLIIPSEARQEYISALRMIRTEATDEHLVHFFFKMAMRRMEDELKQKAANTKRFTTFVF